MARRNMPKVNVESKYVKFKGGLDLDSPALTLYPGVLIATMNYIADTDGGYERIDGYERFDGRAAPSAATYYYTSCTFTDGGPSAGDTITGVTSGATGVVIVVGADYICYTKLAVDVFTATEVYNVGGNPKGTFTSVHTAKGESTAFLDAQALNLAADQYRSDIAAPTGSGAIRGLVILAGVLYAFRDNAGGTAGLIYKQSAAGWVAVTLLEEIDFTTGTGLIAEGDTITGALSGATAVVSRVVLESGEWGVDAAGRLIISGGAGRPFQAENLTVTGVEAAATGAEAAITIAAGGRYEFDIYNFSGSTDTRRIYGCDGVNRGFEFDGTVYAPIDTGMTVDTPNYVKCAKQQLFFSFGGSSQNSGVNQPYNWAPITGASEIAVGDNISGYEVESETIIISSRNSTNQLRGSNVDTFFLDPIDAEIGCIPRTMQKLGQAICLDDRGVIAISRAQEYGNFNLGTLSRNVQSIIDSMRSVVVASSVHRTRNQYRLYGSDSTGICMTIGKGPNGLEYYFTQFDYPVNVACATSGEDSTGKDVVFFGSDAGMVYQADKGTSFDGEDIEAYCIFPYNNFKSPRYLKTFRHCTIEMAASGYVSLVFSASFSYGATDLQSHVSKTIEQQGLGGYWDLANWGEIYWDGQIVSNPSFTLEGNGSNISVTVYSKNDYSPAHKLDGLIIEYTPRRLIR